MRLGESTGTLVSLGLESGEGLGLCLPGGPCGHGLHGGGVVGSQGAVGGFPGLPGVPAGLGVFAEQAAPGEPGALVALAAPAELGAPVEEAAPAALAWVEEPAGRCVLPVPAFLPEEAVTGDD